MGIIVSTPSTKKSAMNPWLQVIVKTMMGQKWDILLGSSATVYDLKVAIYRNNGMHPDMQVLVHRGEEMEDNDEKMTVYDVIEGSNILLQPKLASGFITSPNSV